MKHGLLYAAAALMLCSGISLAQETFPSLSAHDLPGLRMLSEQSYDGNSLWGYIDGGADVYLEYGFSKLLARKAEAQGVHFQIDLYRMIDPESAFGIFSISAFTCAGDDSLPSVHCISRYQVQAARGCYYVSVINDKGTEEARHMSVTIARTLLSQIAAADLELPALFRLAPIAPHAKSVKFIKGRLGIENGYPGWEELFGASEKYSLYVVSVPFDTCDLALAEITFGGAGAMNDFLTRTGFPASSHESVQQRTTGGTTRMVWKLADDRVAFLETRSASGAPASILRAIASLHSSPQPAGVDTVFFDDFTSPQLNRAIWNVTVTGHTVNDEQQAYVDSSSTLYMIGRKDAEGAGNGALVLQVQYRPGFTTPQGKKFDFTSGRIDTRGTAEFTYGTISARMKLPAGTGYWPAFWMLGRGRWPDVGEIDIMENIGEDDWTSVALHGPGYFGETPIVNKYFFTPGIDITAWHVYSVDWTKDTLAFAIDGRMIYRVTRPMVEHYGRWAFDAPKFVILNLALGGAYPVKINGVTAPYHGLPESTVKNIRDGHGRVLVDWVLVTKPH